MDGDGSNDEGHKDVKSGCSKRCAPAGGLTLGCWPGKTLRRFDMENEVQKTIEEIKTMLDAMTDLQREELITYAKKVLRE